MDNYNLFLFMASGIGVLAVISVYMLFAKMVDDFREWNLARKRKKRQLQRYAMRAKRHERKMKRYRPNRHDGQRIYYDDIH